jgi:hypothetical protein
MNISKNMEAIFVSALVIIGATSFATAAVPKLHRTAAPAIATVATKAQQDMPVVVVSAKRLTAAEKAAL